MGAAQVSVCVVYNKYKLTAHVPSLAKPPHLRSRTPSCTTPSCTTPRTPRSVETSRRTRCRRTREGRGQTTSGVRWGERRGMGRSEGRSGSVALGRFARLAARAERPPSRARPSRARDPRAPSSRPRQVARALNPTCTDGVVWCGAVRSGVVWSGVVRSAPTSSARRLAVSALLMAFLAAFNCVFKSSSSPTCSSCALSTALSTA